MKHSCCGIDNLAVFLSRARAWAAHVATMPWWRISHGDWRDANRSYCITMSHAQELPWKILICWWICSNDTHGRSHDRSSLLHPAELIHVLIWSPEGLPWNPHHKESDTQITVGRFSEVRISLSSRMDRWEATSSYIYNYIYIITYIYNYIYIYIQLYIIIYIYCNYIYNIMWPIFG